MRRGKSIIIGVIAGVAIGVAGTAGAASEWGSGGVHCSPMSPNGANHGGAVCIKDSGRGYGVAITRSLVMVYNLETQRPVFTRQQP